MLADGKRTFGTFQSSWCGEGNVSSRAICPIRCVHTQPMARPGTRRLTGLQWRPACLQRGGEQAQRPRAGPPASPNAGPGADLSLELRSQAGRSLCCWASTSHVVGHRGAGRGMWGAGCWSGVLGARCWAGDVVGAGLQSSYREHLGCRCILTERGLCLGPRITGRGWDLSAGAGRSQSLGRKERCSSCLSCQVAQGSPDHLLGLSSSLWAPRQPVERRGPGRLTPRAGNMLAARTCQDIAGKWLCQYVSIVLSQYL